MFTFSRKKLFFNRPWRMEVDPYDVLEKYEFWNRTDTDERPCDTSPSHWKKIDVPSCWNTARKELQYYEGPAWYYNRFVFDRRSNVKYILYFEAANYRTKVWLNGTLLGENEGGFTPFYFDVTEHLGSRNVLIVKVDNRRHEDNVPTVMCDWFNFGGITRPCYIFPVSETFIKNYKVSTRLVERKVIAKFEVWIEGPDPADYTTVKIPEVMFSGTIPIKRGHGSAEFEINPVLWTPEDPQLYNIEIVAKGDKISDRVGFREIRVEDEDILLNGQSIFLRGICLHEESDDGGRTLTRNDISKRLSWAKQLNCNFLRLAHYPHTEMMSRKADEMGIMLWEEIPVYWLIKFDKVSVLNNAKDQMQMLVERDWNRASVICWSVANETPVGKARNKFLTALSAHTKKLDDTRLVSAACFLSYNKKGEPFIDDPATRKFDVIGVNEYHGWYELIPEDLEPFGKDHKIRKPIIITEMGAGALFGNRGRKDQRWTEEFQADIYHRQLSVLDKFERVKGITPWILFDFRAPFRLNHWQKGFNRKGIIDNRGRKKMAFKVLQKFYSYKRNRG